MASCFFSFNDSIIPLKNSLISIEEYGENDTKLYMPVNETLEYLGYNIKKSDSRSCIKISTKTKDLTNADSLTSLLKNMNNDDTMKNKLIQANGSVQNIAEIPQNLKDLYKTVWEISQKAIIEMAADRGAYIDQSQSLNIHIQDPNFGKMTSMHFYAWRKGLKTGMYYLRSKAATDAIKFTVDKSQLEQPKEELKAVAQTELDQKRSDMSCSLDNPDDCLACGS